VIKQIKHLQTKGKIIQENKNGVTFYKPKQGA